MPFRSKARLTSFELRQAFLLIAALTWFWPGALRHDALGQASTNQKSGRATSVREADAVCAHCHEAITNNYLSTPMANASGSASDRFKSGDFFHQPSGVTYSFSMTADGPTFTYREKGSSKAYPSRNLQYFLGSGHLGLTYLYSLHNYLFETPLAYYASHGLDLKPGLESLTTAPPSLPVEAECIRCHMSDVRKSDPGTLNRYSNLPFAHTGITCESCHGDATRHVATNGKTSVTNPSRLEPEKRDSVCISCHLEGDVSVDKAGQSMFDFKPGDSIEQYRSYFVYQKQDPAARGVSEVEQFSQSMCKRTSGASMSCTSCHDPHFSPSPQERVQFYRAKCLACHTGATFEKSHHAETPDCTSCHMPKTGAQNTPHVAWTDHRILKLPLSPASPLDIADGNVLLPVLSSAATARDLGMAYYRALMEGNAAAETKAYEDLKALRNHLSADKDALDALGVLSAQRGDLPQATELFKEVLALNPDDLIASTNLGTLLAKSGDLRAAIQLWEPIATLNPDIVGLTKNLARVKCATGDIAGTRETLLQGLEYSPGSSYLQTMLANLPSCGTH